MTTSDTIDTAAVCRRLAASLDARPLQRNEAVLLSADDDEPRRMSQHDLAEHFAAAGMPIVARRLRRVPIPLGHIMVVLVEHDVRVGVIDLRDLEPALPAVDPGATIPRGASALGVIGALARERAT